MRKYELTCIVQPDLDETAFNGIVEKVSGWITESGGTVDKVDLWGKRRLAYIIHKQRDGNYVLFNLSILPAKTADLERNIRYTEPIMRHMLAVVA